MRASSWTTTALGRSLLATLVLALALSAKTAAAQESFKVELDAPATVRPLLQRYLRILDRTSLPEAGPDRAALARRTHREAAQLLATEGYFSPDVRLMRSGPGHWQVHVDPGPRSRISEVDIQFAGDLAEPGQAHEARRRALREAWALAPGQPFRQADWDKAKQTLLDAVTVRDYPAARFAETHAVVDAEAAKVRLALTLDSGPRFFLGPLVVSGLKEVPADIVERYSTLKLGEPYDQRRLLDLQTKLQNTPYFASVIVEVPPDREQAAAAPVLVQVSEALPKRVGFGVGMSTNTGLRTEASYRNANLLHRGWELSSGLRLEQLRQSVYADVFLPPAPAGYRDSFGALVERSDLQGLQLTKRVIGVTRRKPRGDIETQISLRLHHETQAPDGAEATDQTALTANWAWVRRKVDNVLDPRRGTVLEFQAGGGSRAVLSDQDFLRLYTRVTHYRPVGERDVLILRAEGGVTLAPSRDGIPQDFLFRAGGAQSIRGYGYQSLGVKEGDATVGGRYLATGSVEYVHWFRPDWGVAYFVDAGDAADSSASFDTRVGYGVGARWRSPAGPLAVDLGWGERGYWPRLHFSVAIAF